MEIVCKFLANTSTFYKITLKINAAMGRYTVRRATREDFQPVLDIDRDIYNGVDYLEARYHQFCANPNRHMYVVEDEGCIVSI